MPGIARRVSRTAVAAVVLLLGAYGRAGDSMLSVSPENARQAAVSKPEPDYPPMAKQMKVTGRVLVETIIGMDGRVEDCKPVAGNPILAASTVNAVRKWSFKPFTRDGKATRAVTRLPFNFVLSQ